MSKETPAERKIRLATARASKEALALTPEDAHNVLILLDRVTVTGVNESMLLGVLAQKLARIKGKFNGKDVPPTD
jgi:hypothetical protein